VCNLLEPEADHVALNGNGRCWGTGYHIGTWMRRMGYRPAKDPKGRMRLLRRFFQALGQLQALLDMVVAGYLDGDWYTPQQMREMTRTRQGQRQLGRICLRFYVRADYLQRWRSLLAPALGIVGGPATATNGQQAQELDLWSRMEQAGLRQKDLAATLGKTAGFISRLRRGKKPWPPGLYEKAEEEIAARLQQQSGG
jgi:hypothetical protein